MPPPRILIIAGSDCSGGAGIQADIKTVTMHGGYAMTAITAITAQNTQGIQAVYGLSPDLVRQQIRACIDDIGVDAIKLGMLCDSDIIQAVASAIKAVDVPMVLDPVMVATSGDLLLSEQAIETLKTELIPRATVLTPNIPEANRLLDRPVGQAVHKDDMPVICERLSALGCNMILLKGGHGSEGTPMLTDLLWCNGACHWFDHPKIDTKHTHGTGCTLASALATHLGAGKVVEQATQQAIEYVHQAINTAPEFGQGNGPVNHLVNL